MAVIAIEIGRSISDPKLLMQESDIVVMMAGLMTGMLGLLAEVIVAHHRR